MTKSVISAYDRNFHEGAVLWRATNRPGDALNYRFYERRPVKVLSIAEEAGLLNSSNELTLLLNSWAAPWGEDLSKIPEQSCDFDAGQGLAKAWVYMGALRPLDDILSVPKVPMSITKHRSIFHSLGLEEVRHVAVDFHSGTVNFYFRAKGPLTESLAQKLVGLAGFCPFSKDDLADMPAFMSPEYFTFAVTMKIITGEIKRVAFYALGLPPNTFPDVGDRLMKFFEEAPSYDDEDFTAVAWSFGVGGEKYIKAEKSYCGGVIPLLREWKSNGFQR